MTTADLSSSLDVWIHFAEFGCVVVIIGILGESVELLAKLGKRKDFKKWFSERLSPNLLSPFVKLTLPEKLWIEGISLILVAIGLLIEVVASHVVYGISDLQNLELKQEAGKAMISAAYSESNSAQVLLQVAGFNKEAADAREAAGNAFKLESIANERASKFDLARSEIEKQSEELRAKNLELQKQLQPRIITIEQITNFIFLTDKIQKISVGVRIGEMRDETFNYAWQVKHMLKQAGFKTPDSDSNNPAYPEEIHCDPATVSYYPKIGDAEKWIDLDFVWNSTNDLSVYNFRYEITNGFTRPIISKDEIGDTNVVFSALKFCFSQIGITNTVTLSKPDWVNAGQFQIFVTQKP
jgi:hypothetical protein